MKFLSKPTDSEGNTLATEKYVDKAVSSTSGGGNSAYAEFSAKIACMDFPDGNVVIPDGITSIGDYAFNADTSNGGSPKYTLIKSITIPDSVTSIGNYAFNGCSSLTSITIPSVTSIGNYAFNGCSIKELIIAEGIEIITSTIVICKSYLTSVIIPDSVTSIGNSAFSGCTSLKSITIPDSVTSIGNSAFSGCTSLTSITIPDSVTSIGDMIFNDQYNRYISIYYTGTQEQWSAISKETRWDYGYSKGGQYFQYYIEIYYNYVPE